MRKIKIPVELLKSFIDPGDCWFDHDGDCQGHGFSLRVDELCPQQQAKQILAKYYEKEAKKMTKPLSEMSMTEAVEKAFELLVYAEYVDKSTEKPEYLKYSWYSKFDGTFEEFLENHELKTTHIEDYGDDEPSTFDSQTAWEHFHYGTKEGNHDGWTAKVEKSYGGEGQGDQYWMVVSVSDGTTTRYFRRDGWYASYDGGYLDGDTYEVRPAERLVTVYE